MGKIDCHLTTAKSKPWTQFMVYWMQLTTETNKITFAFSNSSARGSCFRSTTRIFPTSHETTSSHPMNFPPSSSLSIRHSAVRSTIGNSLIEKYPLWLAHSAYKSNATITEYLVKYKQIYLNTYHLLHNIYKHKRMKILQLNRLTHLPGVPHIHTSVNWVNTGSGNGLSSIWHQAITWTNAELLSIGPSGTNFSGIQIKI